MKRNDGANVVAGLALLLSACATTPSSALVELQIQMDTLKTQMVALERNHGEMECGQDLRRLLAEAREQCNAEPESSSQSGSAESAQTEADSMCNREQVEGAYKEAERALNFQPLTPARKRGPALLVRHNPIELMLDRFRCEVLFVDGDNSKPSEERLERLADMARLLPLKQTRYIIVSSTTHGELEARHRAEVMRRALEEQGVPAERIERAWPLPFKLQPSQIRKPQLLPIAPETSDLSRAVWACRTNC